LHSMPALLDLRCNIAILLGTEKLEWWGHLAVKNVEDMFSGVDRILACDRQMDRQTSCDGIVHAVHMRCAVKMHTTIVSSSRYCRNET